MVNRFVDAVNARTFNGRLDGKRGRALSGRWILGRVGVGDLVMILRQDMIGAQFNFVNQLFTDLTLAIDTVDTAHMFLEEFSESGERCVGRESILAIQEMQDIVQVEKASPDLDCFEMGNRR